MKNLESNKNILRNLKLFLSREKSNIIWSTKNKLLFDVSCNSTIIYIF